MRLLRPAVLLASISSLAGAASGRTLLCVDLDREASWRDMAYLAAVPASIQAQRNEGGGALLGQLSSGAIGPEALDFVRRFRPHRAVHLRKSPDTPALTLPGVSSKVLEPRSAAEAAVLLSRAYWRSSPLAVVCREDQYEMALAAAPLASLFRAPLVFSGPQGLSAETAQELERLGVKELISMGPSPLKSRARIVRLSGPLQALSFARSRGKKVSYLAAVNPLDRRRFVTRRLSLAGAQLAAGREGLVASLSMAVEWKKEIPSFLFAGERPMGMPDGETIRKKGSLSAGGDEQAFFLTGTGDENDLKLYLASRDGQVQGPPLVSGSVLRLGGKKWSLSLGTRTKFGKSDVHLTWPTADEVRSKLESAYKALGAPPEHLLLVGFPDSLPHAVIGQGGIVEEQASDLPYAMRLGESFPTIGVGRLISEDVGFATLYAARALAHSQIQSPEWSRNSAQAEWENSLGPLFENAGFHPPHHMTAHEIPWEVEPREGQEGKRASSFSQESPLARAAALAHSEHSDWTSLGAMFNWNATVLLAPTVVESGGCGTACLDRDPQNRSVVARLLRLGAIAYSGGSRELSAEAQATRMEFWNGALSGLTLGQAHRRAQTTGLVVVKDKEEGARGANRYSVQVRMLFGDPAISLHLPGKPKTAPARTDLRGSRLTVYAPEKWSVVKTVVPPDWKDWAGKDLFAVRGPGAFSLSSWGPDGHDVETPLVLAEFQTKRPVKAIRLRGEVTSPLGWSGKWFSSPLPSGAMVHRFLVQMVDLDQRTGRIRGSVPKLEFDVSFVGGVQRAGIKTESSPRRSSS